MQLNLKWNTTSQQYNTNENLKNRNSENSIYFTKSLLDSKVSKC